MRVLVANEPRAYRVVISAALKELRPHLEVHTAQPTNLDEEFLRLAPGLVVCSRTTALIEEATASWVELYPDHSSGARASLAGEKTTFAEMDFDALLSILDEAERLYQTA